MKLTLRGYLLAAATLLSGLAQAQSALIVHDGSLGLEANVVANLTSKLVAQSFTVTPNVGVPGGSLAGYQQIWDVRYNTALSGGDSTAYATYMAGGGNLFLMGENTFFAVRNNTILALISTAGGGTLTITSNTSAQTVVAPFTGPDPVTAVTFLAAGGFPSTGNGTSVTRDAGGISAAIVFSPGTMSAATAGSLIVVLDVNFLDAGATAPLQALANNLIGYLAAPVSLAAPVPTLSEWSLIGLAGLLLLMGYFKLSRQAA